MQVFVKTLTGKSILIQVEAADTVEHVKGILQERLDIPVDRQRLIYGGKEMVDEMTLSEYGVVTNSTLHLVMRLLGASRHICV
jgi:hypothetical protein